MDKGFKLADDGYHYMGFIFNPKENGQKFVAKIKEVGNVDKVNGKLLDFDKTREKLLPNVVEFEKCFEIKQLTEEDIKKYRKITGVDDESKRT